MSDNPTISELLPAKFEGMKAAVTNQFKTDPQLSGKRWPSFVPRMVAEKATKALQKALDQSVVLLFPLAWSRAPVMGAYTDEKRYPPGRETTVFLAEHEFEIDYDPKLNLKALGLEIPLMTLKLVLKPQISGVSLTVRDGHIVEFGECEGSVEAEIKYYEGKGDTVTSKLHTKLKSIEFRLVDSVKLDPPVQIIRPRQPNLV